MSTISASVATLKSAEIGANKRILERAGFVSAETQFSYVGLAEPDKRELLKECAADRRVRSMLIDMATNVSRDVVVSIAEDRVVSDKLLDRKSTRLNSSHSDRSRMPSSA